MKAGTIDEMWTTVLAVVVLVSLANPGGITNYSGKQGGTTCNTCHTGGAAPTVAIMGPASLMPGSSATYTVTVTGGAGMRAGFNAAASAGVFIAGAGTRVTGGEVTHSGPGTFMGGSATFSFTYQAPVAGGPVTMFAAGLSANGAGQEMGDMAGGATLTIAVGGAASADAGVSVPVQPQPAVTPVTRPQTGPPGGLVEGGCSAAGGVPFALLALLAVTRRRRCRLTV